MSSSPPGPLSRVELLKQKHRMEVEQASSGAPSFFDRFKSEKSGLGRVNTTLVQQQPMNAVPSFPSFASGAPLLSGGMQLQHFASPNSGFGNNNNNNNNLTAQLARNSPLTLNSGQRNVSTLEAQELQQQLDAIRSMKDYDASISYNMAPLHPSDLLNLQHQHQHQQPQRRIIDVPSALPAVNGETCKCFCCGQTVPMKVVAFVPRDTVTILSAKRTPTNTRPSAVKATTPSAAGGASKIQQQQQQQQQQKRINRSAPRAKSSSSPQLEEDRGRWRL